MHDASADCCGYENGDLKWREKDFPLEKASVLYQSTLSAAAKPAALR